MKILVSACLLGDNVKYSGKNNYSQKVIDIINKYNLEIVKICPEVLGGLSIPRNPAEILEEDIIDSEGKSVKLEFEKGAKKTLEIALKNNIEYAILKEKSPSCGKNFIYDGSFKNNLIKGIGITASKLKENKIKIFSELDLDKFEEILNKKTSSL